MRYDVFLQVTAVRGCYWPATCFPMLPFVKAKTSPFPILRSGETWWHRHVYGGDR